MCLYFISSCFLFSFCNQLESILNPRPERTQRGAAHLLHLRLGGVNVVIQSLEGDLRLLRLSALPLKLLFTLKNSVAQMRIWATAREREGDIFIEVFISSFTLHFGEESQNAVEKVYVKKTKFCE